MGLRALILLRAMLVAVAMTMVSAPRPAQASVDVDIGFFYDGLAPYGHWLNRPTFGWVWMPGGMDESFRPYADGHWVFTDEYGWMWDSDYEWGWAPFHYGRWYMDDDYGWLWVPGMEWGPAWVTWRAGDGYVGWAPLPPMVTWSGHVGFGWGSFDVTTPAFAPAWVFVEERRFSEPRVRDHMVRLTDNRDLVHRTRDSTRITVVGGRIRNHSVDVRRVEEVTGQRVQRQPVREVTRVEDTRHAARRPGDVPVFRPVVRPARPDRTPPANSRGPPAIRTRVEDRTPVQTTRPAVREERRDDRREERREDKREDRREDKREDRPPSPAASPERSTPSRAPEARPPEPQPEQQPSKRKKKGGKGPPPPR